MARVKQAHTNKPVIDIDERRSLFKIPQRYGSGALMIAAATAALLIVAGKPALGRGLILGALFSVLNFILMTVFLPWRVGTQGRKNTALSLISIVLRYTLLALPLIWAHLQQQYALSTAAVGLFMVQITILGDHLLTQLRNPIGAKS